MEFCKGCGVSCCSHYYIPLSAVDVFLISTRGWDDFLFIEEKGKDDGNCFKIKGKNYALRMKKRVQGGCVFMNENGSYCCGIERCKPSVCAAYPFKRKDGKIVMMENRVCPAGRKPTKRDLKEAEGVLRNYEYEWGLHRRMAARWNGSFLSRHGWPELFIPYAMVQMNLWKIAKMLGRVEK